MKGWKGNFKLGFQLYKRLSAHIELHRSLRFLPSGAGESCKTMSLLLVALNFLRFYLALFAFFTCTKIFYAIHDFTKKPNLK